MTLPLVSVIAAMLITALLSAPASAATTGDLIAAFPRARVGVETAVIDLGSPAARPHLLAGFGDDGNGFAWAIGTESIVEFHLAEPRDLRLSARCMPLEFPGALPQSVAFELNGHPGPRVALGAGMAEYAVAFPAASTRAGWNRLRLRHAWARAPRDVPLNPDRRLLSVAWDFIRFEGIAAEPGATPSVEASRGVLTIPPGTSVGYQLLAAPGDRLAFDAVDLDPGATLTITVNDDGREAIVARAAAPMRHRWETALPSGWAGPVRVTLRADGGTARLHRPAVATAASRTVRSSHRTPHPSPRPNVLVYLVDTLRADHLGCYGYDRPTSPHLDAFARDAILFTNARAESSWTRPTVASLFTGLAPPRHGVHGRLDALPQGTPTVASALGAAGWQTAGFITNGNVAPVFGFAQGFDDYQLVRGALVPDAHGMTAEPLPGSTRLTTRARHWLAGRDGGRPFFLYLHASDPHGPYVPPADLRRRFGVPDTAAWLGTLDGLRWLYDGPRPPTDETRAMVVRLYDAEIANNDRQFGRLLAHLRRQGLYDDTIIVFVADHGEEFYEHGTWEHGKTLYDEVLHVPLLIKLPGNAFGGRRLDAPAQLADVLPSLLAQLGLPVPDGLDGEDVLAGLIAGTPRDGRPTFAHLAMDGQVSDAIEDRGWKLITGFGGGELYDRRRDAGERTNLIGRQLETAGELRTRLAEEMAVRGRPAATAELPSGDVLQNLRALGYVE